MRVIAKSLILGLFLIFSLQVAADNEKFRNKIPSPIDDFQFDYGAGVDQRYFYLGDIKPERLQRPKQKPFFPVRLMKIAQYKIQILIVKGIVKEECIHGFKAYRFTRFPNKAFFEISFKNIPPKHPFDGYFHGCGDIT